MSPPLPKSALPSDLEPLLQLARFSFDWAPALCRADHGCVDYHRVWSMIRLLDMDGASPAGWSFLQRELRKLAHREPPRILISGGADTGLMAVVASALDGNRIQPEIVFIDRCETTVAQNRLFARHRNLDVQFHVGDVRSLDCGPVDAVVAHSFLVFFDDDGRRDVVKTWSRLLKPGGVLLMSNRLAREADASRQVSTTTTTDTRLSNLRQKALAAGWDSRDLETLIELARRFWSIENRKLADAELRTCLLEAGLDLETLAYDHEDLPTGPRGHLHPKRQRAEIVARKPVCLVP
jgi:SAM-dependent methyltransferase